MFYPKREEGETVLGLDGRLTMRPTVIWKIICALSGIFAICESESNASKTVLEKLMRTSQSYTAG